MPRPNEISTWRRYAMQAIMWVVLAGTVGLAALVNIDVRRKHGGELGDRITVGEISVQLPLGWRPEADDGGLVRVREPGEYGRSVEVGRRPTGSVFDVFKSIASGSSTPLRNSEVELASGTWRVIARRVLIEDDEGIWPALVVSAAARNTCITLEDRVGARGRELEGNIDLVKRIAATVQFES
jgi:hypothetical protein